MGRRGRCAEKRAKNTGKRRARRKPLSGNREDHWHRSALLLDPPVNIPLRILECQYRQFYVLMPYDCLLAAPPQHPQSRVYWDRQLEFQLMGNWIRGGRAGNRLSVGISFMQITCGRVGRTEREEERRMANWLYSALACFKLYLVFEFQGQGNKNCICQLVDLFILNDGCVLYDKVWC